MSVADAYSQPPSPLSRYAGDCVGYLVLTSTASLGAHPTDSRLREFEGPDAGSMYGSRRLNGNAARGN